MSAIPPRARKPRKDALYSRDEITVLNRYKEQYRQLTTSEARGDLIRNYVLVDIFNFWTQKGMAPKDEEESIMRMKVFTLPLISRPSSGNGLN
jgi:hypothetical protein